MRAIQAACDRHRQHNDRGDEQTAGEQTADQNDTLSSTLHGRIPVSMPAADFGALG
jgi:hypothetical protein